MRGIRETGGAVTSLSEEEILESQKLLARTTGIFAEPAGAVPIVGVKKLVEEGEVGRDEKIVCIITGHGLKDIETAVEICGKPIRVEASLEKIGEVLKAL